MLINESKVPKEYIKERIKTPIAKSTIKVLVPPLPKYFSAQEKSPVNILIAPLYFNNRKEVTEPNIRMRNFIDK